MLFAPDSAYLGLLSVLTPKNFQLAGPYFYQLEPKK